MKDQEADRGLLNDYLLKNLGKGPGREAPCQLRFGGSAKKGAASSRIMVLSFDVCGKNSGSTKSQL